MTSRARSLVVALGAAALLSPAVRAEAQLGTWSVLRDSAGEWHVEHDSPRLDTDQMRGERASARVERLDPMKIVDLASTGPQWLAAAALQRGWRGTVLDIDDTPLWAGRNTPVDPPREDESLLFGGGAGFSGQSDEIWLSALDPESAFAAQASESDELGGFSAAVDQEQVEAILNSDVTDAQNENVGAPSALSVPAPSTLIAMMLLSRRRRTRATD